MLLPKVGRQQPAVRLAWYSILAVVAIGVFTHLFQFWYMFVTSIKSGSELLSTQPTLWPQHPTLAAWKLIWNVAVGDSTAVSLTPEPFGRYFINSLVIAVVTIALSLPITSFAAYAVSKLLRGPIARWSFLFFVATLFVPAVITLVPNLLLAENFPFATTHLPDWFQTSDGRSPLSLFDNPIGVILPYIFSAFIFLVFKGYFDTIPDSIIQAARVDGGSEFNIFRRIVFPLCRPVYAIALWFEFIIVWDGAFLWQSLILQSPEKSTTAVAIYTLQDKLNSLSTASTSALPSSIASLKPLLDQGLTWNGLIVLGIMQSIPIFIVFLLCSRYLLSGIRIRGLK